jgi:hypothetical protein
MVGIFIDMDSILEYSGSAWIVDKNNPMGGAPSNPASDPQFSLWEAGVKNWIEQQKKKDPNFSVEEPPKDSDNVHKTELKPTFSVSGLRDGMTINEALPTFLVNASAPRGVSRVEYLINDATFAVNYSSPFSLNYPLTSIPNGTQKLTVKVCDDLDNCSTEDFAINFNLDQAAATGFSIGWQSPANNTNLLPKDMPATLKVSITEPNNISVVKFFAKEPNQEPVLIQTKKMIRNTTEQTSWQPDKFIDGTYEVWAEAISWSGQIKPTNHIKINLKSK